eukprot:TRINITY_DN184_c0_g1_i8.p1 TRINITY_DN184_c0_g1~~TRINITY_DN184_c0_g1_i8.p1  ORF type:complete len:317 (+),score=98.94 TRINITY_DN184_c0_g1_i8:153-1103(+)
MDYTHAIAFAFLLCFSGCYAELSYNCSQKKVFLSKDFSLFYDTLNPLHEVMVQSSLHQLRRQIGEGAKVAHVEEMGHFSKLHDSSHPKPKPKPKPTSSKPHDTTKPHGSTTNHHTTKENDKTTTNNPAPIPETTTPHPPVPDTTTQTTTNPEGRRTTQTITTVPPETTTTPEGRRTTQTTTNPSVPPETTTPEGRRTTQTTPNPPIPPDTTTTPEQRRTTSTQTTTPEQRRTTPPPAVPIVLDLEVEVDMGRGTNLVVSIRQTGQEDNKFRLVVGQPTSYLSADSLAGAIRGLEVLGQLIVTDENGDSYLRVCSVY